MTDKAKTTMTISDEDHPRRILERGRRDWRRRPLEGGGKREEEEC